MVHTPCSRSQPIPTANYGTTVDLAPDDADVQRVYHGASDDDSIRIQQLPDSQPEAYFFHTNGAPGDGQYRRLDFSKVQFVSNNFINPP